MTFCMAPVESWQEARPLIESALSGSDSTAEEIWAQWMSGRAALLESDRAFVVLEPLPGPQGLDMLIWAAVSRGAKDCIAAHLEELEGYARKIGAKRLAFRCAPRAAWYRALSDGWEIRQVTWAKDL